MIRTQVYLTEEQSKDIKARAEREKRREADIIRDLLDRGRLISKGKYKTDIVAFLEALEKVDLSGPTDLSVNHDEYLYGEKS